MAAIWVLRARTVNWDNLLSDQIQTIMTFAEVSIYSQNVKSVVEYSNYSYLQFIETVRWEKNQNTKNLILDVKLFSFYGHRVGETPITPQGLLTLLYRFTHRTVKLTWCVNTFDRYNNLECASVPYEKNLKQGSYFGIITENFRSPSFRTANNTHLMLLMCF